MAWFLLTWLIHSVGNITINDTLLRLWDIGGQENLRTLWESYYQDAHAVVFVIDSSDRERLEECKTALESVVTNDAVEGVPILMLANKQDREDHMEVEDIKEIFNKIAEQMGARDSRVLPISALTGYVFCDLSIVTYIFLTTNLCFLFIYFSSGVADAADWLVTRLIRNKQYRPPKLK